MNSDNEIQKANRKAMPKFILITVISSLIGGIIGFCAAIYGLNTLADSMRYAGEFFCTYIASWLLFVAAVIVPAVCVPIYKSANKLLSSWDGETAEISDAIEKKISIVIWITGTAIIISLFLISASYSGGFDSFENKDNMVSFVTGIVGFLAILIETIAIQQKCVDTVKKMNPEKTASVYDTKFQKKWVDSCDEAEKILIGKCAFRAYSATNNICVTLASVLAICALIFNIGFLPSLVVCIIWLVNQSAYCREALRYSKAGNKIS